VSVFIATVLAVAAVAFVSYPLLRGMRARVGARADADWRRSGRTEGVDALIEREVRTRRGAGPRARARRCPACGATLVAGDAYCTECGAGLNRLCAACGATLRPGAAFCRGCGAPVSGALGKSGRGGEGDG